jgi:AraC-like DNA-binding protein
LRASFFGGPGFSLWHATGPATALPLGPHFHDEYLVCAQLRGRERCHVGGRAEEFAAGEVVLINPQQVHTGNSAAAEDLEWISLYLDRTRVRELADAVEAPTASPEFTVVKAPAPTLVGRLAELAALVRARAPALEVDTALHQVVLHTFGEFSNLRRPFVRGTQRVGHRRIARAVEWIRALPSDRNPAAIRLDELAAVAGLSKYHFLRQFTRVVGMTPGAYLRTLRLCHAARRLRTSDLPIADVARSAGFADHPSFSRAFARHMGVTPREYQRLGPL